MVHLVNPTMYICIRGILTVNVLIIIGHFKSAVHRIIRIVVPFVTVGEKHTRQREPKNDTR